MDEFVKRVKEICEVEGVTREKLAQYTQMTYSRWHNLMNGRGTIKSDEIRNTGRAFPHYAHWLIYESEDPYSPQISPETKLQMRDWLKDLLIKTIATFGGEESLAKEITQRIDLKDYGKAVSDADVKSWAEGKEKVPVIVSCILVDIKKDQGWKPNGIEDLYIKMIPL